MDKKQKKIYMNMHLCMYLHAHLYHKKQNEK